MHEEISSLQIGQSELICSAIHFSLQIHSCSEGAELLGVASGIVSGIDSSVGSEVKSSGASSVV